MMNQHFAVKSAGLPDKPLIHALMQPYLDELSLLPGEDMPDKGPDGTYLYLYFDAYWSEPERFPYLLYADGMIAGFAQVRKAIEADERWEMAEFYVKPDFRRHGLGRTCAEEIIRTHRGDWRISFNRENGPGGRLWSRVAARLAKGDVSRGWRNSSHDYLAFSV